MVDQLKFKSESEYVDYLCLNIDELINSFYGETVKEHKRNANLSFRRFGANQPSIDILVTTTTGKRIGIECKNPKQEFNETSRSVSQLLSYAVLADESGDSLDELAIATTSRHNIGTKVIKKYNLPIRVFYIDRQVHGELGI